MEGGRTWRREIRGSQRSNPRRLWQAAKETGLVRVILIGFIGPLIIWLIKKDQSPVVDREGKKALNFQLTVLIAWVAGFVLCFVIIGFVLLPLVWLFWLIFTILAAVKTNSGEDYKYPFAITFLK